MSAYNAGDPGSIPRSGGSPGEGNGNPLQYSCLEYFMDGGSWQAPVHGAAKSRTQLSDFSSLHSKHRQITGSFYHSEISILNIKCVSLFSISELKIL